MDTPPEFDAELSDLTALDDETLEAWDDAVMVMRLLRDPAAAARVEHLMPLPAGEAEALEERVTAESGRREQAARNVTAARAVEYGEAGEESGDATARERLATRAGRLVRLLALDAPRHVIADAVRLVVRSARDAGADPADPDAPAGGRGQ